MLTRYGKYLAYGLFLLWLVFWGFQNGRSYQSQVDRKQIEAPHHANEGIQNNNSSINGTLNSNSPSYPYPNQSYQQTAEQNFLGFTPGESLLVIVTFLVAVATWDLVRGAQDTAKRQLRAYLSVNPKNINSLTPAANASVILSIRNTGQTPAYEVRHTDIVQICPYPLPANYPFPQLPPFGPSRTIVHPDREFDGSVRSVAPFNQAQINAIVTPTNTRLYVFGRSEYEDAFKLPHYVQFCYSIAGISFAAATVLPNGTTVQAPMPANWNIGDAPPPGVVINYHILQEYADQHNKAD